MRVVVTRKCKVCPQSFQVKSHNPHQEYCSPKCYHVASNAAMRGSKIKRVIVKVCGYKDRPEIPRGALKSLKNSMSTQTPTNAERRIFAIKMQEVRVKYKRKDNP